MHVHATFVCISAKHQTHSQPLLLEFLCSTVLVLTEDEDFSVLLKALESKCCHLAEHG